MTWTKKNNVFERSDGVCIKAIFALVIFFHHFFIAMEWQDPFSIACGKLGGIGVGAFFLQSMYGLWKSYQKQGTGYAKRIFFQKIPALYAMQISVNLLYYFVIEFGQKPFEWTTLFRILNFDIFMYGGLWRLNPNSWFMATIILVYAFFGFSILIASLFKEKGRIPAFLVSFSLMMAVYALYIYFAPNVEKLYLRGITTLILGLVVVIFEKQLLKWLVGWKYWLSFGLLAALAVGFLFVPGGGDLGFVVEECTTLFINMFVFVLMMRYTFGKAPILSFLGSISLDFYLLHGIFLWKVSDFAPGMYPLLYFLVTMGGTIIVSYLYCTARAHTKGLWKKICKKCSKKSA